MSECATWRGSNVFNMDGDERVREENRMEKNVQRRPAGHVRTPTPEFHQLCERRVSAPDWQLMALHSCSFWWLKPSRIPVPSQLCGHPETSTVETQPFYFCAGRWITTQRFSTGQNLRVQVLPSSLQLRAN